jgi:hypothetical protein
VTYDVPSRAGGVAGLEGFTVATAAGSVGTVAALNRTAGGLVLLVDTGDGVRVVSAGRVEHVELLPRTILLGADGARELETSPPVEPRVARIESPQLVRTIPRELAAVTREGQPPPRERLSPLWLAGASLAVVGGVGLFTAVPLTVENVGGSLAWVWPVVTGVLFLAGVALLWRAFATAHTQKLSRQQRLGDVVAAVLGVSLPDRRRRP